MHEYRRLQSNATPFAAPEERSLNRVKRKPAASGLNAIERVESAAPLLPSDDFPSSSSSPDPSHDSERYFDGPIFVPSQIPSQHSLEQLRRIQPTPPSFTDHPASDIHSRRIEDLHSAVSLPHIPPRGNDRLRSFKSIRRLPRPGTPQHAEILRTSRQDLTSPPSPHLTPESSYPSLSTNFLDIPVDPKHQSTSTVSLSRFPQPPEVVPPVPAISAEARTEKEGAQKPLPPLPITPNFDSTPFTAVTPPNPAQVHYRGASFDLVNPHHSLYLSGIETPLERDGDGDAHDYFTPTRSQLLPSALITDESGAMSVNNDSPSNSSRRVLFPDAQSAYASITGRSPSRHDGIEVTTTTEITSSSVPSFPIQRSTPIPGGMSSTENIFGPISATPPPPLRIRKMSNPTPPSRPPSRGTSLKDKVAKVFTRKKSVAKAELHATSDEGKELLPLGGNTLVMSALNSNPYVAGGDTHNSAPTFPQSDKGRDIEVPRHALPTSASAAPLTAYYETDSVYPSSIFTRDDSGSFFDPRRSLAFGISTRELDYSSEVPDITSYIYEFGHSRDNSHLPDSNEKFTQNFLSNPHAPLTDSTKDNTINSIIDRYQSADVGDFSLTDIAAADHNNAFGVSGLSGLSDHARLSSISPPFSPALHNLSQFNFGLGDEAQSPSSRGGSSHGSSIEDIGPKTPEQPMMVFPPPHIFRTSPGAAPTIPAPFPPAMLGVPRGPNGRFSYAREFSSVTSPMNSSYGDTRTLLHIPPVQALEPESKRRSVSMPEAARQVDEARNPTDENVLHPAAAKSSLSAPALHMHRPKDLNRHLSYETDISLNGSLYNIDTMLGGTTQSHPVKPLSPTAETSAEHERQSSDDPSTSVEMARGNRPRPFGTPKTSADYDIAIRQATSGELARQGSSIPKIWEARRSPILLSFSHADDLPPRRKSHEDFDDDDEDWETIAEQSRGNLGGPSHRSNESGANLTALASLLGTQNFLVHPANDAYEHEYKLRSLKGSGQEALMPVYKWESGSSFPNRNALTPPRRASTSPNRKDALPTPRQAPHTLGSPFASSSDTVHIPPIPPRRRPSMTSKPVNPFISAEDREADGQAVEKEMGASHKYHAAVDAYDALPDMESGAYALSPEPNDMIFYEPVQHYTWSPTSVGQPHSVNATPAQAAKSSPTSPLDRHNSFSKITFLGPKLNITGTPEGTGMREIGSSLADNSGGSRAPWTSSQADEKQAWSTPAQQATSPLGAYEPVPQMSPHARHTPKTSASSYYTIDSTGEPVRPEAAVQNSKRRSSDITMFQGLHLPMRHKRASVQGQTQLRELHLKTASRPSNAGSDVTRFSKFINAALLPSYSAPPSSQPVQAADQAEKLHHEREKQHPQNPDAPITRPTAPLPTNRLSQLVLDARLKADRRYSPHLLPHPRDASELWPASKLRLRRNLSWML